VPEAESKARSFGHVALPERTWVLLPFVAIPDWDAFPDKCVYQD
jgi:hypothetical protein